MNYRASLTFFNGLIVIAAALWAPAYAESERTRYRVDLIVFENLRDRLPATTERTAQPPAIDFNLTVDAGDDAALRSVGIRPVGDAQFGLLSEWRRLRNSRYHRPLLRRAWIQYGLGEDRAPILRFHDGTPLVIEVAMQESGSIDPDDDDDRLITAIDQYRSFSRRRPISTYRLDGSIQLVTSRFLHLVVDMRLIDSPGLADESGLTSGTLDAGAVKWHRLNQGRRVRRDELHYLDHPRFGILARVTALEPTPEPKAAAADSVTEGTR